MTKGRLEQRNVLLDNGGQPFKGDLFGRPVPEEKTEGWGGLGAGSMLDAVVRCCE
jgi:hypothetical protein